MKKRTFLPCIFLVFLAACGSEPPALSGTGWSGQGICNGDERAFYIAVCSNETFTGASVSQSWGLYFLEGDLRWDGREAQVDMTLSAVDEHDGTLYYSGEVERISAEVIYDEGEETLTYEDEEGCEFRLEPDTFESDFCGS